MISLKAILDNHVDTLFDLEAVNGRELIERIATALYQRHEQFPRWPKSVQHFYACYNLNFQGFAKAAYNVPHIIPVAQEAFERLGRPKAAELCKRAVALLPAELAEQVVKGFIGGEELEAALAHIEETALSELDRDKPSEFWADAALHDLVQSHRADFTAVDSLGQIGQSSN